MHAVSHVLAQNVRNLDQLFAQFEAFKKVREASRVNLERQFDFFRAGGIQNEQVIFLNVLQAIVAWGNAITSESASLTQYNAELANLDRQLGIILENHGVRFYEERFRAIGPLGRMTDRECYPRDLRPGSSIERYGDSNGPAEDSFELDSVVRESGSQDENELDPGEQKRRLERQRDLEKSAEELRELMRRLENDSTEPSEPTRNDQEELPPVPPLPTPPQPRPVDTEEASREDTGVRLGGSWVSPTRAE